MLHQGCTALAWSITLGIISHLMMALVPLPCLLFSHSLPTVLYPSQIINSLISLHFFWSSPKVREALLWPGGGKSSMQACFASVRNACAKLTQHQTQQWQQRSEVGEWARTEKCTSKHHLPWWLKPASSESSHLLTQQITEALPKLFTIFTSVCSIHWQQWRDIALWCFRKPPSHIH